MNLRGRIVNITPNPGVPALDYVCVAHYAGHVELVSSVENCEFVALRKPVTGPNSWMILSSRQDDELIQKQIARTASLLRSLKLNDASWPRELEENAVELGVPPDLCQEMLEANLAALKRLVATRSEGQNANFAAIYGAKPLEEVKYIGSVDQFFKDLQNGSFQMACEPAIAYAEPVPPNYVGKLVFLEVPADCADAGTSSGEWIIVAQSDDSLYGVRTACCVAGVEVRRVPLAEIKVLDVYEDDTFVSEFIQRLDDMDSMSYSELQCDAAETAMNQLQRMLDRKAERTTLNDALEVARRGMDRFSRALGGGINVAGTRSGRMSGQAMPAVEYLDCEEGCGCK